MEQVQQPVKRLIRKYYEDKQLYLKPNSNFLLEDIQRDARLSGLTTRDILILKNTLYELSRLKQYRQKGKQEFRNYITFSPGNYISSIFDHVLRDSISVRLLMMSHPHATSLVIYPFFFFLKVLSFRLIFLLSRTWLVKNEHPSLLQPDTRLL